MRVLILILLNLVISTISANTFYADRTPEQNNQYMQENQQPVTNSNQQFGGGPTNAIPMRELRSMYAKQWNICKAVFAKANKACSTPDKLEKEDAVACVKMYQIAADSCYTAMTQFSFYLT
ncbi:MAG: hypothetical protein CMM87_00200 [Rickettsiales bacterium]|nr:hypothetical protein [Rickettsiales bacterium]